MATSHGHPDAGPTRTSSSRRRLGVTVAIAALTSFVSSCGPPEVDVTESLVEVISEEIGRGRPVKTGDAVCIDFEVLLPDGERVMQHEDFCFRQGAGAVIAGVDETVVGMRVGGERTVLCPPHKHWGRSGYANGAIPALTTLTLEIKVVSIP